MNESSFVAKRIEYLGSFGLLSEVASEGGSRCWICYDVEARGPLRLLMARILSPEDSGDPYAFEEMKDEALLVSRTMHTSLPCVEAVGSDDGRYYVVYHMVEGGSFSDLLKSSVRPPRACGGPSAPGPFGGLRCGDEGCRCA